MKTIKEIGNLVLLLSFMVLSATNVWAQCSVSFTHTPLASPLTMRFEAVTSGFVTTNSSVNVGWWFDSNNSLSGSPATYTFPQKGVYAVSVVAMNNYCQAHLTNVPVSVGGCTMQANYLPTVDTVAHNVTFTSSITHAGTPPYSYQWAFCDYYNRSNTGPVIGTSSNITVPFSSIPVDKLMKLTVVDAAGCINEAIDSSHNLPNVCTYNPVNFSVSETIISPTQVRLTLNTAGGTAPYTYSSNWYDPTATPTNASGGNSRTFVVNRTVSSPLSIYINDANGCYNYNNYWLRNFNCDLGVSITSSSPSNGAITLTPQVQRLSNGATITNYSAAWNTGANTNMISVPINQTATYTVTITDSQTGCTATASTRITDHCANFALSLTQTALPNNQVQMTATTTGGTPPYSYSSYWYNPATSSYVQGGNNATVIVTPATVNTGFSFYATDANGCTRYVYDTIIPTACANFAVSLTQTTLPNNQVQMTATATGGTAPYTYNSHWYDFAAGTHLYGGNNATVIFTPTSSTAFYINVTDAIGCSLYAQDTIILAGTNTCSNSTCVFPGDADHDGAANLYDVLVLGADYGHSGGARTDQSLGWYAHERTDWTSVSPTINVNEKHADCNGNGIINYGDTTAIGLNYHRTHNGVVPTNRLDLANALPVYLQFSADSVVLTPGVSNTLYADVYVGTGIIPAQNLYGVAMTLNYPSNLVQQDSAAEVIYDTSSFMGQPGNILLFQHDIRNATATTGQLDFAVTRTNHGNVNGFGRVCRVKWVITENISGRPFGVLQDRLREMFTVSVSGVRANDNQLRAIDTHGIGDQTLLVGKYLTSTDTPEEWTTKVAIYPNPVTAGKLTIDLGSNIGNKVMLTDAIGQNILEQPVQQSTQLDLSNLSQGVYILVVQTDLGTVTKRIVVAK